MKGPSFLLATSFLLLFLPHVIPFLLSLSSTHIDLRHARTTRTDNPSDSYEYRYLTAPYHLFVVMSNSRSQARYNMTPCPLTHQFSSLSYNVFTFCFCFYVMGLPFCFESNAYDHIGNVTKSRPIWPKPAGSAPSPNPSRSDDSKPAIAITVRGGIFIFSSGIHTSVPTVLYVFR